MNRKNERIRKLWDRGVTDLATIARKLGYSGAAITAGIERVKEGLTACGIGYEDVHTHVKNGAESGYNSLH